MQSTMFGSTCNTKQHIQSCAPVWIWIKQNEPCHWFSNRAEIVAVVFYITVASTANVCVRYASWRVNDAAYLAKQMLIWRFDYVLPKQRNTFIIFSNSSIGGFDWLPKLAFRRSPVSPTRASRRQYISVGNLSCSIKTGVVLPSFSISAIILWVRLSTG